MNSRIHCNHLMTERLARPSCIATRLHLQQEGIKEQSDLCQFGWRRIGATRKWLRIFLSCSANLCYCVKIDLLGHSRFVKGSPTESPVSAGSVARGVDNIQHGSNEAPIHNLRVWWWEYVTRTC